MTSQHDKAKQWRFTLLTIFLIVSIVCIGLAALVFCVLLFPDEFAITIPMY